MMPQPRHNQDETFTPCTWDAVRLAQARRFASWLPDEKLAWLTSMVELFPQIIEASRQRAMQRIAESQSRLPSPAARSEA